MSQAILFVGAGPGNPELLTLRALRALEQADVILHDRLISSDILNLKGPNATLVDVGKKGFGPHTPQEAINAMLVAYGAQGKTVVRLKAGDCTVFGRLDEEIEAVTDAGLSFEIVPGITSASAAVAALGQSFTRRGRNSSLRIITGHDAKGYADHDWRTLATDGEVTVVYMGAKAARFLQGRFLMHGAAPQTPVSFVENASRREQKIVGTTLDNMVRDLNTAAFTGPVLTFIGLAPRDAAHHTDIAEEFA